MQDARQSQAEFRGDHLSVKMFDADADGRLVTDGAIDAGTNILNSATALFTPADVEKVVWIEGAGPGGLDLLTSIDTWVSDTQVLTVDLAGASVTGAETRYGRDSTAAIQAALDWAAPR